MGGGVDGIVRGLREEPGRGILQRVQGGGEGAAFATLGKSAQRVEDVDRIRAAVLVGTERTATERVLPSPARVGAGVERMAANDRGTAIEKGLEVVGRNRQEGGMPRRWRSGRRATRRELPRVARVSSRNCAGSGLNRPGRPRTGRQRPCRRRCTSSRCPTSACDGAVRAGGHRPGGRRSCRTDGRSRSRPR